MSTPPASVVALRPKNWLDWGLSWFADVRGGEAVTALLLAANIFAIFTFYYIIKTVREALILSEGGAELKSYAAAGQALLLLGFVPLYGALASRVNRVRLIGGVTVFFASHLVIFYLLGVAKVPIGFAFFLWAGLFALIMPAQLWAFANDVYDADRGKRLFPIVGVGASLGAWLGAWLAGAIFATLGPYRLLLVAAAGVTASVLLTLWIDRRERSRAEHHAAPDQPLSKAGGFQLVLAQRYLLYIALLVVVLNIVNTIGEFILGRLVVASAAEMLANGTAGGRDEATLIGEFYSRFFFWVNLVGFAFQMLLVSRLFKWIGVRGAVFVLPVIATISYGMLVFVPLLSIVSVAKVLENGTDYSVWSTTRHALFLPTSREAKYKAKQAIEGFFWRAGDLLQAVVIFVGVQLAFTIRGFALINLGLVVVWVVLGLAIGREHRKLTEHEPERTSPPAPASKAA